jgi:predicted dehydrogenase
MRIAIVGAGFVADYYLTTLANYPALNLAGAWDRDELRLREFCAYHCLPAFDTLDALLGDPTVETVVNLTSPDSHFRVSMAALDAGKHVYSEKPLAMSLADAERLVGAAAQKGLILAGAPANALSDAFRLTKDAVAQETIGRPRLVYAEMEDGPVFRENWRDWRSTSGARWPGRQEFEIGCTLEHAGYALTWLIGLFGPIGAVTGQSGTMFADKGEHIEREGMGPDFASACLEFEGGVIARLTCGLCAPRDRSLTIMGETGTLTVADLWDNRSAVRVDRTGETPSLPFRIMRKLESWRGRALPVMAPSGRTLRYPAGGQGRKLPAYPSRIDFSAGIQAIADCLVGHGKDRKMLAAEALHVTEAALALNSLAQHGGVYTMKNGLPR